MTASQSAHRTEKHQGQTLDRAQAYDIIDCETCGFVHALPLPDPAALEQAYREQYYKEEKPDYLSRARSDQEWAELAQRDRLQSFANHLPPGRRVLIDVGSGPGYFLKTAQAMGWQAIGVEPSSQAAAHTRALGLGVIEGFFGPALVGELPKADALHMNHVLEHVPNPAEILRAAHATLRDGGIVCVNVPNDYSPFQRALRDVDGVRPWWLAPPHHLNYFDFASLNRLLRREGFVPLEETTSFPMEMFILMGENYIGNDETGRACHARRMRFDLTLEQAGLGEVRRRFYRALASVGLGRDACIIARRTDGRSA
ncbi:MAG: class I SAM-dependent methyltransferase [Alphaproteobacteria bacterium]|nr:class I SAM-dependent methyltransferase [Alphaproteobacteria bacterium]